MSIYCGLGPALPDISSCLPAEANGIIWDRDVPGIVVRRPTLPFGLAHGKGRYVSSGTLSFVVAALAMQWRVERTDPKPGQSFAEFSFYHPAEQPGAVYVQRVRRRSTQQGHNRQDGLADACRLHAIA